MSTRTRTPLSFDATLAGAGSGGSGQAGAGSGGPLPAPRSSLSAQVTPAASRPGSLQQQPGVSASGSSLSGRVTSTSVSSQGPPTSPRHLTATNHHQQQQGMQAHHSGSHALSTITSSGTAALHAYLVTSRTSLDSSVPQLGDAVQAVQGGGSTVGGAATGAAIATANNHHNNHNSSNTMRTGSLQVVSSSSMSQQAPLPAVLLPAPGTGGGQAPAGTAAAVGGALPAMPEALDEEGKLLVWKLALKCADLGHLSSPRAVHRKWVQLLEEEMFRQGDREQALGYPVSPLMDRRKAGVTRSQPGFFNVVVLPLYSSFCQAFPQTSPMLDAVKDNLQMWLDEAGASCANNIQR